MKQNITLLEGLGKDWQDVEGCYEVEGYQTECQRLNIQSKANGS